MNLSEELGFRNPIQNLSHEAVMSIVLTGTMLAKEGDRILKTVGLTDAQFNVLMILKYQSNEGVMNQTTLGSMLLVNRSNVTGLIDRLEQAGYVQRLADAVDRRVNLVKLTKKGEKLLEKAIKVYFERLEQITESLSDQDLKRICSAIEQIRDHIREKE